MHHLLIPSLLLSSALSAVFGWLLLAYPKVATNRPQKRNKPWVRWVLIFSFFFAPYRIFHPLLQSSPLEVLVWHWFPLFGYFLVAPYFEKWVGLALSFFAWIVPGLIPVAAALSFRQKQSGFGLLFSLLTFVLVGMSLTGNRPNQLPQWTLPQEGALKAIHLVLPHPDHPLKILRKWRIKKFDQEEAFQLDIQSSRKASLGFVVSFLLLASMTLGIQKLGQSPHSPGFGAWIIPILFLTSVGGLVVCVPLFVGLLHYSVLRDASLHTLSKDRL